MRYSCIYIVILYMSINGTLLYADQTNYLNYYAVTNSIDGQPMVDMVNILRFFPVYALRKNVSSVFVTVYYGSDIYSEKGRKINEGEHWDVPLPLFNLGEAIQKIEVEVTFDLDQEKVNYYKAIYAKLFKEGNSEDVYSHIHVDEQFINIGKSLESEITTLNNNITADSIELANQRSVLMEKKLQLKHTYDSIIATVTENDIAITEYINKVLDDPDNSNGYQHNVRSALNIKVSTSQADRIRVIALEYRQIIDSTHAISIRIAQLQSIIGAYGRTRQNLFEMQDDITALRAGTNRVVSSLIERLDAIIQEQITSAIYKEIWSDILDTSYVGPSVRKSDIIVDKEHKSAKILYRNYKPSLRRLPALDPVERMGIFRARYVPFPVVGIRGSKSPLLRGPFGNNPVVFEVGLTFGDAIVPGDEFVVPEFSFKRMGIAFAITEKLFGDDAEIIAIAFTYDFNSYGSIGAGWNFAQNVTLPYFSFGINKKAFETALSSLAKLFTG